MPTVGADDQSTPAEGILGAGSSGDAPERPSAGSEMRKSWAVRLLALLVVVAVSAWIAVTRAEEPSTGRSAGESVIQQFPVAEREAVDDFGGEFLGGGRLDSSDLDGQVAVYNVWGSWCAPCRQEAPALARVARETTGRVTFVGINVRDSEGAARAFERRQQVPYESLRSEDSDEALLAFGSALAVAVPTTVVVDREGRIAARVVGPTTYVTLRELVDEVVAEGVAEPKAASSPSLR